MLRKPTHIPEVGTQAKGAFSRPIVEAIVPMESIIAQEILSSLLRIKAYFSPPPPLIGIDVF